MRVKPIIIVCALLALALTACGGESASDKAKSKACDARSDIKTQVDTLRNLPIAVASIDKAKTAAQAIADDLQTIDSALPDIEGDLKGELQTANTAFKTEVQKTLDSITSQESLSSAATALTTAGSTLASSYQTAFGNVGC